MYDRTLSNDKVDKWTTVNGRKPHQRLTQPVVKARWAQSHVRKHAGSTKRSNAEAQNAEVAER